jgi:hypothetical protein
VCVGGLLASLHCVCRWVVGKLTLCVGGLL